jgi:hypothetical protein
MPPTPTVLRSADANEAFGKERVLWAVSSGRWQRPARGVLVRHSGSLTSDERLSVELLAQPPTSALAGLTVASLAGLKGFPANPVYIVVPHVSRPNPRPGVVVKRTRLLTEHDIHPAREPRQTRLPRAIVDAAAWAANDLRAQTIIASSVQQGLVTPQQLTSALDALSRLHRRPLLVETIRDVGGGSLSEYEVLFVRMCREFGLPMPTRQRRRKDAAGRSRYLDAEFDEYDLVAEIDGMQHMEPLLWWDDMMRMNEVVVDERKEVLRFAGFALRHQREQVAAVLARFFATRSARGPNRP